MPGNISLDSVTHLHELAAANSCNAPARVGSCQLVQVVLLCPGTAPPGPSAGREGQTNSEGMKVVKLLDQASEDGPRDSLREQVGDHHDAGEVFDGDDTTADEIAKELGGTQDVLGFLEGDGVEGHADGGLAVAVDDAGAVDGKSKVDQ